MQIKEYKSPEEALKEVEDPIIRSAIEPLSDKVAEMEEIAENLKKDNSLYVIRSAIEPLSDKVAEMRKNGKSHPAASFPLPSSNVRKVIDNIDDVIEILVHYKKMLNKAFYEMGYNDIFINSSEVLEVDEYLFTNEIDYLYARVNEYLNLNLCKPLPYFQKLVDYSRILYSARNIMEAGYVDIVSRTTDVELLSNDLHITTLLEIAINYKAEEHEGKQD